MPVNHEHKDYKDMSDKWNRCIDVCKGQDTVHEKGPLYLPKLSEQEDYEYLAYKRRATFYNATWRTISGLQGMIFRKPPTVVVPEGIKEMLKNVDLNNKTLHMFALEVCEECLKLGRVGVFTDYPDVPEGATLADAKNKNFRPALKMYTALSIINWKTKAIKNATVLSMVVLKECKDVPVDEFKDDEQTQYRVLDLVRDPAASNDPEAYIYRVRVMHIDEKGNDVTDSTSFPKIENKHLDFIPFQFMGVDDASWVIDEPPLIDLVDMNVAHYRVSADYEHGCHFTGLPTPVISGYQTDTSKDEKFCIGSMTAWVFPNPAAKASYLEFTGQGLQELRENLNKKEQYMAILGARMLEPQVNGVEAADTAAIHQGGEQSTLSSVAQTISLGLQKSVETFAKFASAKGEVKIELNRDFFSIPVDSLKLTAIIAGWQNGAYSYDTMFANLKKGEIVPVEATAEDEQKAIKANPPPLPPGKVPTTPGNVENKGPKPAATPATPAPTQTQLQNKGGQN